MFGIELYITAFLALLSCTDGYRGNGNKGGGRGGGYGLGGFHSGHGHQGNGYSSGICSGARRQQGSGVGQSNHRHNQNQHPKFGGYNNNNNGYFHEPSPIRTFQLHFPSIPGQFDHDDLNLEENIHETEAPRTTTPAPPVTCTHPTSRDLEVFDHKCIFPHSTARTSCSSEGSVLPLGTTAITTCKAPQYYSATGDLLFEVCRDGKWQGEGKTLICKSTVTIHHPVTTPPSRYDPVFQYVTERSPIIYNEERPPGYGHDPDFSYTSSYPPFLTTTTTTTEKPTTATTVPTTTTTVPTTTTRTTTIPTTTTTLKPIYHVPHNVDWRNLGAENSKPPSHHRNYSSNPLTPSPHRTPPPQNQNEETDVYQPGDPGKCPPLLNKPGVILECLSKSPRTSNGETSSGYLISVSDCQDQQPSGTEATFKCQMYYEPITGEVTQYRKCKESGTWTGTDDGFGCKLECGKSNPGGILPLITFGEATLLGQWPWHVGLFIRDRGEMKNACGGSLISRRTVLTAAHCVNLHLSTLVRDYGDIRVDLGRYHREKDDSYVQKFRVEKIVTHPAYNPFIFESDIAIIILKEPARIGFHVRPICYPKAQNAAFDELNLADGAFATVVGWGLDETGESPDELRAAKLKVIGYKECIESFEEADTGALLAKSTTFCAGNNNGTNVCRGDSGSGAYFAVKTYSGEIRWFLQGLVSLGINVSADDKKCDPEKVSIFTRISPYSDWIVRVMSDNDAL